MSNINTETNEFLQKQEKQNTTEEHLKSVCDYLIMSELKPNDIQEGLFLILDSLVNHGDKGNAITIAENLTFHLYQYIPEHDNAFRECRKRIVKDWRFDEPEAVKKESKPLDLSDCSIESLSLKLSNIMQNPLLPKKIFNCLADEIGYNADFDSSKPEVIKTALKNMEGEDE